MKSTDSDLSDQKSLITISTFTLIKNKIRNGAKGIKAKVNMIYHGLDEKNIHAF
jgi:hypothetical protein